MKSGEDKDTRCYVEASPCKDATAKTVAMILANEIVPRWGMPLQLDSDRGTHFTGSVLREICKIFGIKQRFHIPYHPQSSGMVERMDRTLKNSLSKAILEEGDNWVQALPAILLRQRATPSSGTGLTPFELMTGRAMHLPEDVITGGEELVNGKEAVFQCMRNLITHLHSLKKHVITQQQQRDWMELVKGEDPKLPAPGDKVMVRSLSDKKGLSIRWEGPVGVIIAGEICALIDEKYGPRWRQL